MKRWQDWVNAVLGAALIASPWVFGFAQAGNVAAVSAWVLGAVIVLAALAGPLIAAAWGEALMLLIGICSILSPWLLGYRANPREVLSAVILGALVALLSLWATITDAAVRQWMQHHLRGRSPAQ